MNILKTAMIGIGLMLAQPAIAESDTGNETKLLYVQVAGEFGKLGPEFREKNAGKAKVTSEMLLYGVIPSLPENTLLCIATKNARGTHFLISKPKPDKLLHYHFWQKPD